MGGMVQVDIHYAKTHLSHLLKQVEQGEEVVIAKGGKPIAYLVKQLPGERKKRQFGLDEGRFEVPEDFDEPLSDFETAFYGIDK